MSQEIKPNSKREIETLLEKYVVTKINSEIKPCVDNVSKSMDEVKDELDAEISKILPAFSRKLDEVEKKIKENDGDINDEITDLKNYIEGLREETDGAMKKTLSEVKNSNNEMREAISETGRKLDAMEAAGRNELSRSMEQIQAKIAETGKMLDERIREDITSINTNEENYFIVLQGKLGELSIAVQKTQEETIQLITGEIKKAEDEIKQAALTCDEKFVKVTKELEAGRSGLAEKMDLLEDKMTDHFEKACQTMEQYHSEFSADMEKKRMELLENTERRYKFLVRLSFSMGIINFLGTIAAVIILHFV